MKNTKIIKCTCLNSFQDGEYGTQNRVHNKAVSKSNTETKWRCSVCAKEVTTNKENK